MSAKGGSSSSGNFPINVIAQAQGLDQVTSQLTRFAEMLKTAGSSMQQQITQMNNLGSAFTRFSQSSTGVNSAITQTSNTLKQLGPSATSAGTAVQGTQQKMTQFMDVTKQTGTTVTQAGNQIKTLGPSAQSAGSAVTTAGGSLTRFMDTAKQTGSTVAATGNQIKTLGPSTQQAGSAATTASNQFNSFNGALRTTETSLGTATGQFKTLSTGVASAATTMTEASTGATNLGKAIQGEAQSASNAIANTTRYASVLNEAGIATTTLAEKQNMSNMATQAGTGYNKSMTDSIIHGTREVSAMGMGFMMLTNTMSDSSLVQENIKMQTEKVQEAQQRLNDATAKYGKDSTQARQAASALAQAQRGLAFETREATAQQHNMMFMQAMIASEILSAAIPALLKYKDTVAQAKEAFAAFQTGIAKIPGVVDKVGSALTSVANISSLLPGRFGGATKAAQTLEMAVESGSNKAGIFSGALQTLGGALQARPKELGAVKTATNDVEKGLLSGATAGIGMRGAMIGLGAAGAVLGIALVAVATNAFGFRDAIQGAGKAIGDAVPILSPFLEGIQGIGGALGLTGETAEQTKTHFTNMTNGFQNMGTLWNDTVAGMQGSNNLLVKSMGDTAAVLGVDMTNAFTDLRGQIGMSIAAFNQFIDALGKGDYTTATIMIEQAFAAIPGIIGRIMIDVGTILYDSLVGIGKTLGPIILGIGNVMGQQLLQGLQAAWQGLISLVNTYVVQPIQNAINGIASGIQNIAGQVWVALHLQDIFNTLGAWISTVAQGISNIGAFVTSAVQAVWNNLGLMGMFSTLAAWIQTVATGISNIGSFVTSIVSAVWTKLGLAALNTTYVQPLVTQVAKTLSDVATTVTSVLNMVWTKWGLAALYTTYVAPLIAQIYTLFNTIANYVTEVASGIWAKWALPALSSFVDGLMRSIGAAISSIANFVKPVADFVWQKLGLGNLVSSAQTLGGQIIDAIVTGINNGLGKVQQALSQAGANVGSVVGGAISSITPGASGANEQKGSAADLDRQRALENQTKLAQAGTKTTPAPTVPSGTAAQGAVNKQQQAQPTPGTVGPPKPQTQPPPPPPATRPTAQPATNQFNTNIPGVSGGGLIASVNGLTGAFSKLPPVVNASGKSLTDFGHNAGQASTASQDAANKAKLLESNQNAMGASAAKLGGDIEKLKSEVIGNALAIGDSSAKDQIKTAGMYEQEIAQQALIASNIKSAGALEVYNGQIADGSRQNAEYTAGVLEQSTKLNDLIAANAHAAGANATFAQQLTTTKGINAELNKGYQDQGDTLNQLIATNYQTMGSNAAYAQQLANGTMQTAMFTKGQVEQQTALMDIQSATAQAQGTNAMYAAQLANGTMQTAQFAAGQAEANKALNELQGNTAHTQGVMSQYIANLASGKEISAQFAAGQADAAMKLVQLRGDAANAAGQFEVYKQAMMNVNDQTAEYVAGMIQGRNETAQMVLEMSNAKGVYLGTRDVLVGLAQQYGLTGVATNTSNAALQQFVGVMRQSPDAIQAMIDKLNEFSSNAVSSLSEAMNKGADEVKKALDQIQADIGRTLTKPELTTLTIEANTKNATDKIMADMSLALAGIREQSAASVGASIDAAMAIAGERVKASSGTVQQAWLTVMDGLKAIKADPLNSPAFMQEAAKIVTALQSIGIGGEDATKFMTSLGLTSQQAQAALQAAGVSAGIAGQGLMGVGTGAQSSDPLVAAFNQTLAGMAPTFGTLQTMAQQTFGQIIPQQVTIGAQAITTQFGTVIPAIAVLLGALQTMAQQTFGTIIPAQAMIGVNLVIQAFNTLPPAIVPMLGQLQALAQQTFGVVLPQQAQLGVSLVIAAFNTLPPSIVPMLGQLQALFQQTFGVILPQQAQIGVSIVIATFNTLPGAVAPVMGQLQSMAQQTFTIIGQLAMLVAQGVNTAYAQAEADANGYLNSMRATAASVFSAIGQSAIAVTNGVNNAYRQAESDANGYLNSMRATAANTFAAIGQSAQQVASGVNTAFTSAQNSAISAMNNIRNTAIAAFGAVSNAARTAAQNVANIGGAANAAASAVNSLRNSVESLPNVSRTITYTYRTVGSPPAFQFGGNMLVDKPSLFIAGEANRKERVKVAPGTMAFVEDLSKELREKFSGGYMGTSSGWGGLGGMGAHIAEWVNNFIDKLFHQIGWPFYGDFPGGHGGGGHGGGGGGGHGGGGGGGGTTPPPVPERFLKNPSMKNFGFYPVGHPLAGMPILTENPGAVHNGAFEEPYPNIGTGSNSGGTGGGTGGGGTGSGGGTGTGSGGGGSGTGGGGTGGGTGTGSDISQIISQIDSISQTSNQPGQNNYYSHENINTGSNVIPLPGSGNVFTNAAASVISQSNAKNNVTASGNTSTVSTQTRVVHEQPVPITLEIDGSVLTKKIIKLVMEELNNAGVYG